MEHVVSFDVSRVDTRYGFAKNLPSSFRACVVCVCACVCVSSLSLSLSLSFSLFFSLSLSIYLSICISPSDYKS